MEFLRNNIQAPPLPYFAMQSNLFQFYLRFLSIRGISKEGAEREGEEKKKVACISIYIALRAMED